ncbi:tail assembly protein [Pseudomonas delhiensis]|uniref:tail assembly protein n=1 Tax=Pseudomonas delhiensis TaxID=366289 RepID=UPI003CC9179E
MTTIRLYGVLGTKFGRVHQRLLESHTVREALDALKYTIEGFEKFMARAEANGLTFAVFRGGNNLGEDELDMTGTEDIRIAPIIIGSKRDGLFQTILGGALIAIGYFSVGTLSAVGVGMMQAGAALALGGVVQMLSPQPKGLKSRQDPANTPSYAFGGPVNTIAQGNPVGILYGRRRIGGAIISAGIHAEDQM